MLKRLLLLLPLLAMPTWAAEPDPRVLTFTLPDQIPWGPVTANGNQQAVLVGDPAKCLSQ